MARRGKLHCGEDVLWLQDTLRPMLAGGVAAVIAVRIGPVEAMQDAVLKVNDEAFFQQCSATLESKRWRGSGVTDTQCSQ